MPKCGQLPTKGQKQMPAWHTPIAAADQLCKHLDLPTISAVTTVCLTVFRKEMDCPRILAGYGFPSPEAEGFPSEHDHREPPANARGGLRSHWPGDHWQFSFVDYSDYCALSGFCWE